MEILNGIIFPFLLGLLGFIEPCSMGTNLIFFQYMLISSHQARLFHGLLFMLTRAIFLSLIGLSSALVGQKIIGIQGHYINFLGIAYMAFGLIILLKGWGWGFSFSLLRLPERSLPLLMGVFFGLAVPACASPLILALAGAAAISGRPWFGLVSLFIFGLGLSLPLVIAIYSVRVREAMSKISNRYHRELEYIIGIILILAGLYTYLAKSGSLEAILQK